MRAPSKKKSDAKGSRRRKRTAHLPPGRPTKQQISESNEHLLRIALNEFLRKGFRAASINGIAKASRISRVAIYRRYGNKETLFTAVCERAVLQLRADLRTFTSNSRDPEQALEEIALHIYDDYCQPQLREVTRLMLGEVNNFPQIAQSIYQQTFATFQPLADFFRKLDQEGVLRIEDPTLSAFQFAASIYGSLRPLVVSPAELTKNRKEWVRNAVKTFLYGCAVRKR